MIYLLDTDHLSLLERNDATLLTRNLSDFGKIPALNVEDWSL